LRQSMITNTHELADLIARITLGDRAAFAALYRHSSAHLLGVILRIQSNRALAEDVLQEVFINVWRSAHSFNPALSQASTWLVSIARHRAIDSLRQRKSEVSTVSSTYLGSEGDEEHDLLEHLADDAPTPPELLERSTQARSLATCMQALSTEQKNSLALAYFQGLSHGEVAQHLGQPLGSVKSWVRRGMQSLKSCLERASVALN
jgi:RNA polymerase sigma factor (sigma-70 family)